MNDWPIGTKVVTPPILGERRETVTASKPFYWGRYVLVWLAGLAQPWECRCLMEKGAQEPAEAASDGAETLPPPIA